MSASTKPVSIRKLAISAMLLALGFILSIIKFQIPLPGVGSITLVSMLPLVILGYKYGPVWGGLCGLVHGTLQVIEGGWYPPPINGAWASIVAFLLDYAIAWGVIGVLAGLAAKTIKKPQLAVCVGSVVGLLGRYLSSFISGVLIWGSYAPEGQGAVLYSITANGSYMIPEIILTAIVSFTLFSVPALRKMMAREVTSVTPV